jgi:glutamate--cysteine ligase
MNFDIEAYIPHKFQSGHGIEKEGLRVTPNGKLASTQHPVCLGSKLTHPMITTDYAETLMEFVTPVGVHFKKTHEILQELHKLTYSCIKDELIWPVSMPSLLPEEKDIHVADYGHSNIGKMKTVYRKGLGHRYGKSMQMIAGIHYNFSLPTAWLKEEFSKQNKIKEYKDYVSDVYFHLIRNFRRHSWLLTYLYGSSPVVDENFLTGKDHQLEMLSPRTFGLPHATCLRMGGLGYTSSAQSSINVCFNKLNTYIQSIEKARTTSYEPYEKIGTKVAGEYRQLSTNLIQIDNEFYSRIRPKRVRLPGMNSLMSLHTSGIEYLEVRLLDVNPFDCVGITREQMKFLNQFLLFCLFQESPILSSEECRKLDLQYNQVVTQGRDPSLGYHKKASDLLDDIYEFCSVYGDGLPQSVLEMQQDPKKILSQRFMDSLGKNSFTEFTLDLAKKYRDEIMQVEINCARESYFQELVQDSINEQMEIEANDKMDFDDFLKDYYQKTRLNFS